MHDALVLLALRLLAALPLPVSQALGWCVGSLACRWSRTGSEPMPRSTSRSAFRRCRPRSVAARAARTDRERLHAARIAAGVAARPDRLLERIDPQDGERWIRELLARGKGLIFAAPHLGNWEMGVHFLTRTTPTTVLYRPPAPAGAGVGDGTRPWS